MDARGEQAGRDSEAERPHDRDQQTDADEQTEQRVVEREAVPMVPRNVARVLAGIDLVGCDFLVQTNVAELHSPEADLHGTVRILGRIRRGVMAAMYRDPFP